MDQNNQRIDFDISKVCQPILYFATTYSSILWQTVAFLPLVIWGDRLPFSMVCSARILQSWQASSSSKKSSSFQSSHVSLLSAPSSISCSNSKSLLSDCRDVRDSRAFLSDSLPVDNLRLSLFVELSMEIYLDLDVCCMVSQLKKNDINMVNNVFESNLWQQDIQIRQQKQCTLKNRAQLETTAKKMTMNKSHELPSLA